MIVHEQEVRTAPAKPIRQRTIEKLGIPGLRNFAKALRKSTGWQIRNASSSTDFDAWHSPDGRFTATPVSERSKKPSTVTPLLDAVAEMATEVTRLRHELARREIQLAQHRPVRCVPTAEEPLSQRLQSTLANLVRVMQCDAAAVYLLDETSSQLVLQANHGLSLRATVKPPRPLKGAKADLEALAGKVISIADCASQRSWKTPEHYASAICIGLSSGTTSLGTLWLFSDELRDFEQRDIQVLEIAAETVAMEIERFSMLGEVSQTQASQFAMNELRSWQKERSQVVPPTVDGWDVATADSANSATEVEDFHDWRLNEKMELVLAVGGTMQNGPTAILANTALKAATQVEADQNYSPADMLSRLNQRQWASSTGADFASLCVVKCENQVGVISLSHAGHAGYVLIRNEQCELARSQTELGFDPDTQFEDVKFEVHAGEILIALSDVRPFASLTSAERTQFAAQVQHLTSQEIANSVMRLASSENSGMAAKSLTALVAKRNR